MLSPTLVLVADDDDDARALVASMLRGEGFTVDEAGDGATLLAHARSAIADGDRIALVLSDINMPELDGLSAARQILALEPSLHIVLMSAFADAPTVRKARAVGAKKVLRKPFAVSEVLELLPKRAP